MKRITIDEDGKPIKRGTQMTQIKEDEIREYIIEYQRGKSGIYPGRLAEHISARYLIPYSVSAKYILDHIHSASDKAKGETA